MLSVTGLTCVVPVSVDAHYRDPNHIGKRLFTFKFQLITLQPNQLFLHLYGHCLYGHCFDPIQINSIYWLI